MGGTDGGHSTVTAGRGAQLGGNVQVFGGVGDANTGGHVSVVSGAGTSTSSGSITIKTPDAGVAGISGALVFSSGTTSSGSAGSLSIGSGHAVGGKGGAITVTVGDGNVGTAGAISITAGKSTNTDGGAITITSGVSTAAAGGSLALAAGASNGGDGGALVLTGGTGAANNLGGGVSITGGTHGTSSTGGDVTIKAGGATNRGKVKVYKQLAAAVNIGCTGSVADWSRACTVTSNALAIDLTFPGGTYELSPDACQTVTVSNSYLEAADIVMCFVGKRAGTMTTHGFPGVSVDTLGTGSYTVSICNVDSSYSITENVDIYCVVHKTETTRL